MSGRFSASIERNFTFESAGYVLANVCNIVVICTQGCAHDALKYRTSNVEDVACLI